jgi:hypothetical protein
MRCRWRLVLVLVLVSLPLLLLPLPVHAACATLSGTAHVGHCWFAVWWSHSLASLRGGASYWNWRPCPGLWRALLSTDAAAFIVWRVVNQIECQICNGLVAAPCGQRASADGAVCALPIVSVRAEVRCRISPPLPRSVPQCDHATLLCCSGGWGALTHASIGEVKRASKSRCVCVPCCCCCCCCSLLVLPLPVCCRCLSLFCCLLLFLLLLFTSC